ncbi:DUF4397 domain-containing protein [bacterium]|nr:DUF4397 domain-containing protein [bacterium]
MFRKFSASLAIALGAIVLLGGAFAWASPTTQGIVPADADAGPTVTVAHFAPFAADAAGTSVTVRINGTDVITNFTYPQVVRNAALSAGPTLVEILPTGTETVAISATLTLSDDVDYTVYAIGDVTNQPLELFAQVDDNTPPTAGAAKLRLTHLAPFAATLEGTEVDICTQAGTVVAALVDVPFKATSGYLELPAGDYDLKIAAAGTNCGTTLIDVPSVRLLPNSITEVAAIGDGTNFPPTVAATTDLVLTPATVSVGHFAPFASAAISTSVTVRIDGSDVITGFTYPNVVKNAEVPAGERLIEILPTGTETVAISATVVLTPLVDYTVSAIGDVTNQSLELFVQVDDNTAPTAGNAKLRITHLAPFANTLDGTRVDICTESGQVVAGLAGVPYKASSGYLELPAGDYDLKVTAAGSNCANTLIDVPSVRLADGSVTEVVAIGDGANFLPSVTATTDLSLTPPAPATVSVGHFAPFASETISTSVTVRIDGSDVITGFTYPNVVQSAVVPSGERLIEILPTGTETVAISATVVLSPSADYTVSAIGDVANQPLELFVQVDDNTAPTAGNAKLRITHLAPFANTLDGTRVDVCTEAGQVVAGLTGVPYKASSGYFELPAGDYDLKVTAAGSNCATTLIDVPSVRLAEGSVTEVVAIGNVTNFAPSVTATTDLVLTPAPATVTVAHFAPFAATLARQIDSTSVTVRIDGSDVITGFTYPNVVKDAVVPSGERLIEILPTGTETVAISATVVLSPSVDYTVSAIGDGTNQSLELYVQVDDNTAPPAGNAKLRITHLAPFANTLVGTEVDVCLQDGTAPLPGLNNVPYRASSGYFNLPIGQYDLKVTVAGSNCATTLIDLPLVELVEGQILEITAIGDGVNAQPGVTLTAGDLVVITILRLVSIFN